MLLDAKTEPVPVYTYYSRDDPFNILNYPIISENTQPVAQPAAQPDARPEEEDVDMEGLNAPLNAQPAEARIEENRARNSDNDDGSSDGCGFLSDFVPFPLSSTCEGLIKYKNDSISGDISFIITVRSLFC